MLHESSLHQSSGIVLVSPPTASDQREACLEEARRRLHESPYRGLHDVICADQEGVLVLRGCVPTYYLKQMAQSTLSHIDGVDVIFNSIEVVGSQYPHSDSDNQGHDWREGLVREGLNADEA